MKINELIKAVTKDYMPIAKRIAEAKKRGDKLDEEMAKKYFELSNTLEFYKIIKGMFMREVCYLLFNCLCIQSINDRITEVRKKVGYE